MKELSKEILFRVNDLDLKKKIIAIASIDGKTQGEVVLKIVSDFVKEKGASENQNLLDFYQELKPIEMKRYLKFKANKAGANLTLFFEKVADLIEKAKEPLVLPKEIVIKALELEPILNKLTSIYSQKKLEL